MTDKIQQFMEGLGLTDKQINSFDGDEPKADVEKILSGIEDTSLGRHKELLENDTQFIGKVAASTKGKILNTVNRDIKKRWGLDIVESELAKTQPHELLDQVLEQQKDISNDKSSEAISGLQDRLVEATNKISDLEENVIPKIKNEATAKANTQRANTHLRSVLANMNDNNQLIASTDATFKVVDAMLNDYKRGVAEDGSLQIFIKGQDGVKPTSEDGKRILSPPEIIESLVINAGLFRKSNGKPEDTPDSSHVYSAPDEIAGTMTTRKGVNRAVKHLEQMGL